MAFSTIGTISGKHMSCTAAELHVGRSQQATTPPEGRRRAGDRANRSRVPCRVRRSATTFRRRTPTTGQFSARGEVFVSEERLEPQPHAKPETLMCVPLPSRPGAIHDPLHLQLHPILRQRPARRSLPPTRMSTPAHVADFARPSEQMAVADMRGWSAGCEEISDEWSFAVVSWREPQSERWSTAVTPGRPSNARRPALTTVRVEAAAVAAMMRSWASPGRPERRAAPSRFA